MPTVLIAGANRGIGLEFVRQYAADGWTVIATARRPDDAQALKVLGVRILPLDTADPKSVATLADTIGDQAIDLLIANAGVMGPTALDADGWFDTLRTNSIGPVLVATALKANVAAAGGKMVAISSRMGSIGDNDAGGFIAYRSSKAALNAAWKTLANEWRGDGVTLAVFHPGWVQTDMGGPGASIDPPTSVTGMRKVIDALAPDRTGSFLAWDGAELPW